MPNKFSVTITTIAATACFLAACTQDEPQVAASVAAESATAETAATEAALFLTQPLVTDIFTADPSAHVFNGRIYVYPSHDIDSGVPSDDLGNQYDMKDYIVLSMDRIGGPVTIHDVALDIKDVPWAGKQMWAPDAAEKDGKYYLYFPVKDKQGVFAIGAAVGDKPEGPFMAQPEPIQNTFSMDPSVFKDEDGQHYLYFGGIWGGQLQHYKTGAHTPEDDTQPADDQPALMPKIARLADNMVELNELPMDVQILDANGELLLSGDHERRFFEAAWMHKYNGNYYLSYSTGDSHYIAYAMGTSPYGPFTYKGNILMPVLGWTNHHSIVEVEGKWYLFYHDAQHSDGINHLRNVKQPIELTYNADGTIQPIDAWFGDDITAE